jgi:hypothetical protein
MDRRDAIAWVVSVCSGLLRASQVKTLSILVAAALPATRLTLANLGREAAAARSGSAKHAIKRCWRFTSNKRVEPADLMPALMSRLWRRRLRWHARRPDRRPLLVSLDWTKVRRLHTLMAAAVVQGRALPLCWQSYRSKVEGKSQNALEYAMLLRIKAALPAGLRVAVLADRGFGRAELAAECQKLGLEYLVRICPDVIVKTRRWRGVLRQFPLCKGQCFAWPDAEYRSDGVVKTGVIARWKRGLPAKKDEPWYLITSLPVKGKAQAIRLSELYALRFDIEELFRDAKNEHLGWSLCKTRIRRPDRLDRLILVAALAYLLLAGLGLWCRAHRPPRLWASNNRPRELSAFAIGRVMLTRVVLRVKTLVDLLLRSLATTEGNWG